MQKQYCRLLFAAVALGHHQMSRLLSLGLLSLDGGQILGISVGGGQSPVMSETYLP